jgi:hypothetical protein
METGHIYGVILHSWRLGRRSHLVLVSVHRMDVIYLEAFVYYVSGDLGGHFERATVLGINVNSYNRRLLIPEASLIFMIYEVRRFYHNI